jgi:hypothetical protein
MRWVEIHTVTVSGSRADDEKCCADTDAMWQYRSAKVTFYLRPLATMTLQDIDSVIVHELVHVLLSSMESAVAGKHTDQCELAVENVARAILAIQKGDK